MEFASDDPGAAAILDESVGTRTDEGSAAPRWRIQYDHPGQLLQALNRIQRQLNEPSRTNAVRCRVSYEDEENGDGAPDHLADEEDGWVPVGHLFANAYNHRIVDYIVNRRFTSHMQPIVQSNGDVMGYEFLLRPLPDHPPFRPAELFAAAREAGLHSFLDREARYSAIRVASKHAPSGVKKFINFLPSSIYKPEACLRETFGNIAASGMEPADFVFEVVETERLDDAEHLAKVFDAYRGQGIRLAMDDLGEGYATFDVMDRLEPDYVKLDRRWISGCNADSAKQRHIVDALDRASRFHGTVLAEGVENEAEWRYLRQAGVPLLQGYYFGKPAPVPMPASVIAGL